MTEIIAFLAARSIADYDSRRFHTYLLMDTSGMSLKRSALPTVALSMAVMGALIGCRPDTDSTSPNDGLDEVHPKPPRAVLNFPLELTVADATVNEFVAEAMKTCANGNYDSFRLLWSAREELITKREYERGWRSVLSMDIRALEQVKLAPDPERGETEPRTVYAILAHVAFDPAQTTDREETERNVVLVVAREHDAWRLRKAPRELRRWLTDKINPQPVPRDQGAQNRTTG